MIFYFAGTGRYDCALEKEIEWFVQNKKPFHRLKSAFTDYRKKSRELILFDHSDYHLIIEEIKK